MNDRYACWWWWCWYFFFLHSSSLFNIHRICVCTHIFFCYVRDRRQDRGDKIVDLKYKLIDPSRTFIQHTYIFCVMLCTKKFFFFCLHQNVNTVNWKGNFCMKGDDDKNYIFMMSDFFVYNESFVMLVHTISALMGKLLFSLLSFITFQFILIHN